MQPSRKAASTKPLTLDETLAELAIHSVYHAFETLFNEKLTVGNFSIERGFINRGDISGIIGMVQSRMEATLTLTFEKQTISHVIQKVYDQKIDALDTHVRQGVGELTNVIYAMLKKELNNRGHRFKMAIPNVIFGMDHSIVNIHEGKSLVIPFETEKGSFILEIAIQNATTKLIDSGGE